MQQIRIGISTCLLGQNVRYNGGHSLDRFLRENFIERIFKGPAGTCCNFSSTNILTLKNLYHPETPL